MVWACTRDAEVVHHHRSRARVYTGMLSHIIVTQERVTSRNFLDTYACASPPPPPPPPPHTHTHTPTPTHPQDNYSNSVTYAYAEVKPWELARCLGRFIKSHDWMLFRLCGGEGDRVGQHHLLPTRARDQRLKCANKWHTSYRVVDS